MPPSKSYPTSPCPSKEIRTSSAESARAILQVIQMSTSRAPSQSLPPDASRNRDRQPKIQHLIAGIKLPVLSPWSESSFSAAYDRVYDCGIRNGQSKARTATYAAYRNSCVDLRRTLSSLLEKVGLDADNDKGLQAAEKRRGKDYSLEAKIAAAASAALGALERGLSNAAAANWAVAFEQLVLAGRRLGEVDEMSRGRTAVVLKGLFEAREKWRRTKSEKHRKFNSAAARDYGNETISRMSKRRLQNWMTDFNRSCLAPRNRLLATGLASAYYDPHRGEPKRTVKPKNARNHSGN